MCRYRDFVESEGISYRGFLLKGNKVTSEDMDRGLVAQALAIMSGAALARVCVVAEGLW